MAKTLVTGGAGFVGSAIVKALLARDEDVRVLVRKHTDLRNLDGHEVEYAHGDLYHPESLQAALKDVDTVYHAAAVFRFFPWWKKRVAPIYKINIKGTKNLIECAKRAGVKKFIHTSSMVTIGRNFSGGLSDETTPMVKKQLSIHYTRTKYRAESIVLDEAKKGFPAVVVNPGMVFGPGDYKPTPTGMPIVQFLNKKLPGYFNTAWTVADVRDVAEGHLAACEKGKVGERYILCNKEHLSMKQIFQILEKVSGVKGPKINIPYPALLAYVYSDESISQWTRHQPLLPSEGVEFCRSFLKCDNTKAVRELEYKETPIEETLEYAVKWYRDNHFC